MHVSYKILIAQMASQKRVSIPFFISIDLGVGGGDVLNYLYGTADDKSPPSFINTFFV